MAEQQNQQGNQIQVQLPDNLKAGVYSNGASITVRDDDVVLDFGSLVAGVQPPTMQIVSRVIMTPNAAEKFVTAFQNSLLDHRNKKSQKGE